MRAFRILSKECYSRIKPGNRIELLPLSYFWEDRQRHSRVSMRFSNGVNYSLEDIVKKFMKITLYYHKRADLEQLAMLILRQPLRTVLHLFRTLDRHGILENKVESESRDVRGFHAVLSEEPLA